MFIFCWQIFKPLFVPLFMWYASPEIYVAIFSPFSQSALHLKRNKYICMGQNEQVSWLYHLCSFLSKLLFTMEQLLFRHRYNQFFRLVFHENLWNQLTGKWKMQPHFAHLNLISSLWIPRTTYVLWMNTYVLRTPRLALVLAPTILGDH